MSKKRVMKMFEAEATMTAVFTVWGDSADEVRLVLGDRDLLDLFEDRNPEVSVRELPKTATVEDGIIFDGEWIAGDRFSDELGETVVPTDDPAYLQPGTEGYQAHMEGLGQQRLFDEGKKK